MKDIAFEHLSITKPKSGSQAQGVPRKPLQSYRVTERQKHQTEETRLANAQTN